MTKTFKVGDLVVYKAEFLRNICWYTNVPHDGRVTAADEKDPEVVSVQWCDREEPIRILAANLILKIERHLEPA